jgi:hypothetical protein
MMKNPNDINIIYRMNIIRPIMNHVIQSRIMPINSGIYGDVGGRGESPGIAIVVTSQKFFPEIEDLMNGI